MIATAPKWKPAPSKGKAAPADNAPKPVDNSPTAEHRQHATFTCGVVNDPVTRRAVKVYRKNSPLDIALAKGRISRGQFLAGGAYAEHRARWLALIEAGATGGCALDMTPRGGGEASPEYAARVSERERKMRIAVSAEQLNAVEVFVVDEKKPRRGYDPRINPQWRLTFEGLDALAEFFGHK